MAKAVDKRRTGKDRAWVKVQLFNQMTPGEDIAVPDEFGVLWQIKDKSRVKVPAAVASALEDAIIDKLEINNKKREVKKVPKVVVVKLSDDAKVDNEKEDEMENELLMEKLDDIAMRSKNAPDGKNSVAKHRAAKKIQEVE